MPASQLTCPVCQCSDSRLFQAVDGFDFFDCPHCESIFIDPTVIAELDEGRSLVEYTNSYWKMELASSRARSFGSSLARVAEACFYARRDIRVFLDIGAGPGFLLDAIATYLPSNQRYFYGVEKFLPSTRSTSPNLFGGTVADFPHAVDGGSCIEMIEHLTPEMLRALLQELSIAANDGAVFIVNSGQPNYVKYEDIGYLDPKGRGHIISYSVKGLNQLSQPYGFSAREIPGKTWALLLEKSPPTSDPLEDRIWSASTHNSNLLIDPDMGNVMQILGMESIRAYRK